MGVDASLRVIAHETSEEGITLAEGCDWWRDPEARRLQELRPHPGEAHAAVAEGEGERSRRTTRSPRTSPDAPPT